MNRLPRFDRYDALLLGALLGAYLLVTAFPFAPDGEVVVTAEARKLGAAIRGDGNWSEVTLNRFPAPVVYYSIPFALVPSTAATSAFRTAAVVWNAIWMGVALLLVRRSSQSLAGAPAGLIAGALVLLAPFSIYYALGVQTETPAYLGVVLGTWAWTRWRASPGERFAGGTAVLACLGWALFGLSRPNGLLLLGIPAVAAVMLWRRDGQSRRDARFALAAVAGTTVIVGMVAVGLRALQRGPSPQGAYMANVAFHGSFQYRTEPWDWRFWDDEIRPDSRDYQLWRAEMTRLENQADSGGTSLAHLQRDWVLADVVHHPLTRIRMSAIRAVTLQLNLVNSVSPDRFRLGPLRGWPGYLLFHIVVNLASVLVLAGAAYYLLVRRAEWLSLWPLWGPWLALLVFHAAIYAEPRYLFPSRAALVIMAGAGLATWLERRRLRPAG